MTVAPEELRRSMRQEFVVNRTRLGSRSYFEAFERATFEAPDLATLFHENSKYREGMMGTARRSVAAFESAPMAYTQAKLGPDHPGLRTVRLPEPARLDDVSLGRALRDRRSPTGFVGGTMSAAEVATILGNACGVTGTLRLGHDDFDGPLPKSLRAYPSAGGLYPVEAYLLVNDIVDIPSGRYYYVPERHRLRTLDRDGDQTSTVSEAFVGVDGGAGRANIVVVLTAALWRGMAKYGPRGYRYLLQESGHLAQNLLLAAAALGLSALPVGGFYDDAVNDLLGIDGTNESTIYGVAIGRSSDTSPGAGDDGH